MLEMANSEVKPTSYTSDWYIDLLFMRSEGLTPLWNYLEDIAKAETNWLKTMKIIESDIYTWIDLKLQYKYLPTNTELEEMGQVISQTFSL